MNRGGSKSGRAPVVPLLARVRAPQLAREAAASAEKTLRDSVLQHLQAMCSTRLGSVPIRPDYGLPDVSEMVHSFPDAIDALARALTHTIEKYEPRLLDVVVRHVPSDTVDLVVRFEVTARIADLQHSPVRFETRIDSSRRVQVE
ncbi:MAG: type VI secretion system baseplate subunit TssE [Polyangiaceae bacterium]|nr:type VI secretion system baseplate subunit TssE [Polyangiaceae bacterium]